MKKMMFVAALCLAAAILGACAKSGAPQNGAAPDASAAVLEGPENPADLNPFGDGAVAENDIAQRADSPDPELPMGISPSEDHGAIDGGVDLDLSQLSGTVVYSQIYDMIVDPSAYMGKRIRIRGDFNYFKDPNTQKEYFAAVIADATACCAQGIEFVWAGEHSYPGDYPPLYTEITVTGILGSYEENGSVYLQLLDADMR